MALAGVGFAIRNAQWFGFGAATSSPTGYSAHELITRKTAGAFGGAHGRVSDTGKRPVYPYSVIPGGARSRAELQAAVKRDPVVAKHYSDFDVQRARVTKVEQPHLAHVSYRVGDKVLWTRKKVRLAADETLLSDGVNTARTRCGNRIAEDVPEGGEFAAGGAEGLAERIVEENGELPLPGFDAGMVPLDQIAGEDATGEAALLAGDGAGAGLGAAAAGLSPWGLLGLLAIVPPIAFGAGQGLSSAPLPLPNSPAALPPAQSGAGGPDPVSTDPAGPTDPGPTDPGPTDPGPTDPGPMNPAPGSPAPGNPPPANPAPPAPISSNPVTGPGNPTPGPVAGTPPGSGPGTGSGTGSPVPPPGSTQPPPTLFGPPTQFGPGGPGSPGTTGGSTNPAPPGGSPNGSPGPGPNVPADSGPSGPSGSPDDPLTPTPEPGFYALLAAGLVALLVVRAWRERRAGNDC